MKYLSDLLLNKLKIVIKYKHNKNDVLNFKINVIQINFEIINGVINTTKDHTTHCHKDLYNFKFINKS